MANHKLVLDDYQDLDFCLYGIHSELEDYRLAHSINKNLKTRLKRQKNDLAFNLAEKIFFNFFEWDNSSFKVKWNLIKNKCQIESQSNGQGLFAESQDKNIKTTALLEEYGSVDYFLKISGDKSLENKILAGLNKISKINMVYIINLQDLKAREYLILN